jgi:hypothetical protein
MICNTYSTPTKKLKTFMPLKLFKLVTFALLLVMSLGLNGCGIYSFTGASISPDIKTISVETFVDNSGGPPTLSQVFSEKLREYYQRNTNLGLIRNEGDLQVDGTIVGYTLAPIAPQAGALETAALNRLTISIKARFVNTRAETQNFESTFSHYEDFPENQSLSQVEQNLIELISNRIVIDIFNRSVANW